MFNLVQGLSPTQFMFVGVGFVLVFLSVKDYIFGVLNIEIQDEDNK